MAAQLSFFFFFVALVIFIGLMISKKREELNLKKQSDWVLCNEGSKKKFDYSNVIEVAYEPCD